MRVQISTKSMARADKWLKVFDWLGICTRYGSGRVFGMNNPDVYVIELSFANLFAR